MTRDCWAGRLTTAPQQMPVKGYAGETNRGDVCKRNAKPYEAGQHQEMDEQESVWCKVKVQD